MPIFRWFVGGRELDTLSHRMTVVEGDIMDGDSVASITAVATLRYQPMPEDHGKYLACRAINEYFPGRPKEDGYIINVRCKWSLQFFLLFFYLV